MVFGTPPLMNATEAFWSVGYGVTVKYNSSYPTPILYRNNVKLRYKVVILDYF